jgi:putative alpha-1,2-mannosidase
MVAEVKREYAELVERDMVNSHLLDISLAAHCLAGTAERLGQRHPTEELIEIAAAWSGAFDQESGYIKPGEYYEGNRYHYSFRLIHRMKERVDLCGGPEMFERLLDRYFGYGAEPVRQIGRGMSQHDGMELGRFDGLNNEVMMETPFAYHFTGRPDKTNEIVHGIQKYHFSATPGGLCGNDDSGALTSWYVWNAIGLFPMVGAGRFFVSLPLFDRIEVRTCGFVVRRHQVSHSGGEAIYPERVVLNGQELHRSYVTLEEVLAGGHLDIHLSDRAGGSRDDYGRET